MEGNPMTTEIFRPLMDIMSGDKDYPISGNPLRRANIYEVAMTLKSNGSKPTYSFKGSCHSNDGVKDHFSSRDGNYIIRFSITNPHSWTFDATPFRVIDKTTGKYYFADFDALKPTTFDLHVTLNKDQPGKYAHAFNLYVVERLSDRSELRKIDPDVDNPPIGLDTV